MRDSSRPPHPRARAAMHEMMAAFETFKEANDARLAAIEAGPNSPSNTPADASATSPLSATSVDDSFGRDLEANDASAAKGEAVASVSEQTARVFAEVHKTIRSGAPGLSDQTCNVLAGIIARKGSTLYAQPHPSQRARAVTSEQISAQIRAWLDADDPTHWGSFERALDAALTSEAKG